MTQHLHDPNIQEAEAEVQVQSQPRIHSEALCKQVKRKENKISIFIILDSQHKKVLLLET